MPIESPELNLAALQSIIIIIGTGLIALIVDLFVDDKRIVGWMSLAGVIIAGLTGISQQGNPDFDPVFQTMAITDPYAHFFNLIILFTAGLSILVAMGYLNRVGLDKGEYYVLLLFAASGMMIMAAATDLMIIFLGLEIMSIALYIMSAINRDRRTSGEAGVKYFMMGAYASAFFLYGAALAYGASGSTNLNEIGAALSTGKDPIALVGLALLIIGFAFKVAAFPFHWWTPDVYYGAPVSVTTFMSVGAKAAGFAALVRVLLVSFGTGYAIDWQIAIAILAVLTMTLGNLAALGQKDVKRMLAYSSIAHAGYVLVGVVGSPADSGGSALFYLMVYAFMNIGAFAVLGVLERKDSISSHIKDFAGLAQRNPWLAAAMGIFMLSLLGFPPLAGFWGKMYVFRAAAQADFTWLAVVGMINSAIGAFYYLNVIIQMYFHKSEFEEPPAINLTGVTQVALGISVIATIIIGIWPSIVADLSAVDFFG
ncbi:MAG: NADH-quinone oxidoreductase subunit N [Chloroflexota bacterium]